MRREGQRIVLEPLDAWPDDFLRCIGAWWGEIPRPKQDHGVPARDPFGD